MICITRSPHPHSLPAGEGGQGAAFMEGVGAGVAWMGDCGILTAQRSMQPTPDLPPLRGGIKGGVNPVCAFRSVGRLHHAISPPSFPPRCGGRPGRGLHAACGRGVAWMGDCGILDPMTTRTDSPPPEPDAAQDALGRGVYDAGEVARVVDFPREAMPVRRVQEFR